MKIMRFSCQMGWRWAEDAFDRRKNKINGDKTWKKNYSK